MGIITKFYNIENLFLRKIGQSGEGRSNPSVAPNSDFPFYWELLFSPSVQNSGTEL